MEQYRTVEEEQKAFARVLANDAHPERVIDKGRPVWHMYD